MKLKNEIYTGAVNRKSLYDLTVPQHFNGKMILFLHGYKGFKDWGCWQLLENFFVKNDFGFCKFNFSHNGATTENGIDFPDLQAFGENRYSYELFDTAEMISLIEKHTQIEELILIGHSRGGAIATLSASNNSVSKLITLASIGNIATRFLKDEKLSKWKEEGVYYVKNGRTQQEMPHFYSFYEDFLENQARLNLQKEGEKLNIPCLHIHGDMDKAVSLEESEKLASYTNGSFVKIRNTQHTFDSKQPWSKSEMPTKMKEMCEIIYNWLTVN